MRKTLAAIAIALLALASGAAWWAYGQIGKIPGELMDYAQRRLQGHNKLEWVALPVMAQLRSWLDQPSRQALLKTPFVIPPPPALVKTPLGTNSDTSAPAAAPTQRILRVGPFEDIRTIAKAAKLAKDGDIVEIQAGEYHGDVTLWMQKKLTIRTRGGNARLFADGKSAESKAIWVIRDGDFHIENIDFIATHVYDHNGAGIRFEDSIEVLNSRDRNMKVFEEIVDNIRCIGLKKPITVTERPGTDGKLSYHLVCGEGRLNAFRILGETHIPALVVDVSRLAMRTEDSVLRNAGVKTLPHAMATCRDLSPESSALPSTSFFCWSRAKSA